MLNMRKALIVIPFMTLFADIAILLDIPILREIVVFIFLSFIPGYAILRLFKLKESSFLDTILFSAGLSVAFVMFMGLLVNELYLFLGFSQSLSTLPLMISISAFTLAVFFIEYRRDLSDILKPRISFEGELRNVFPSSIILFLPPLLSILGVLYLNVSVILLSEAIIATLCVLSVVSRRLIPERLFPFLIFSISIALVCQVLFLSKYIVGYDANLEYYVFRLTQINGHWGFLNSNVNSLVTLTYNSMLSITLLPAVYSALMQAKGEIVFKILYPFLFCLVPLTLYRIFEKQFGKLTGLLSALFFIFTSTAFYDPEMLSLNRQIVGELFFLLSVFLLISKTIPVTKRRWLLIIFGASLAVSHYSLAYIYLAIVALVFIISRVKRNSDNTLNTLTTLLLFLLTFSWYALTNASLASFINTAKWVFEEMISGLTPAHGTASSVFYTPPVFTVASWINLLVLGVTYLFLIIGVLLIILRPKGTGIFAQYRLMVIVTAIILASTYAIPNIAATLNFTRFYGITLLFLSPCFVLGGQGLLVKIGSVWRKMKRPLKRQMASKNKNIDLVFLLIAILLGAYFLSQVGFVNNVTKGSIRTYNVDFYRMMTSSDPLVAISFSSTYIPEQDVSSAVWLLSHERLQSTIYADYASGNNVLRSYGLVPSNLINLLTYSTVPLPGSFVYFSRLNVADHIIITSEPHTNETFPNLSQSDLVYSNGDGEIWYNAFPR